MGDPAKKSAPSPKPSKTIQDKNIVSSCDIQNLLTIFASETYNAESSTPFQDEALFRCIDFLQEDYNIITVSNRGGELSFQYPSTIPIIQSEKCGGIIYENQDENRPEALSTRHLFELFNSAKFARARQRFPVPVIYIQGKYICRSSTLACPPEACWRAGMQDISLQTLQILKEFLWPSEELTSEDTEDVSEAQVQDEGSVSHMHFCDKVRNEDVNLLKELHVSTIVDIMVEKRKIKHGLYVSSSEKVDRERYSCFNLVTLPYPGCEWFKDYNKKMHDDLSINWSCPRFDAPISVSPLPGLNIDFSQYRQWDITNLTQNYIKYVFKALQEESTGLLLHCISGWDRTPLFMSLIRMLLWAEGLIHQSLDKYQIVYFTLAYDWMLFAHDLPDRLYKGEEIMYFCFDCLQHFESDDYCFKQRSKKTHDLEDFRGSALSLHNNAPSDLQLIDEFNRPSLEKELEFMDTCSSPESNYADADDMMSTHCVIAEEQTKQNKEEEKLSPVCYNSGSQFQDGRQSRSRSAEPGFSRKRTESTSSTESWQICNRAGGVEAEMQKFPPNSRGRRIQEIREVFIDSYQKTIQKETYGPPKKSIVEGMVIFLSDTVAQWSQ